MGSTRGLIDRAKYKRVRKEKEIKGTIIERAMGEHKNLKMVVIYVLLMGTLLYVLK